MDPELIIITELIIIKSRIVTNRRIITSFVILGIGQALPATALQSLAGSLGPKFCTLVATTHRAAFFKDALLSVYLVY